MKLWDKKTKQSRKEQHWQPFQMAIVHFCVTGCRLLLTEFSLRCPLEVDPTQQRGRKEFLFYEGLFVLLLFNNEENNLELFACSLSLNLSITQKKHLVIVSFSCSSSLQLKIVERETKSIALVLYKNVFKGYAEALAVLDKSSWVASNSSHPCVSIFTGSVSLLNCSAAIRSTNLVGHFQEYATKLLRPDVLYNK